MNDLFEKSERPPHGKMLELARWARHRGSVLTSDVAQWGVDNFYVSAVRAACLLAERGYLRRLTEEEQAREFPRVKGQGVWVPTDKLRRMQ